MKRYDFWRLSLLNIFASPGRSILTVLGMAIGIGAILAVLTLGDAGKSQVQSEMARLGIDKVWLTASDGEALRHGDGQLLEAALSTGATEQVYAPVDIRFENQSQSGIVVGCSSSYMKVMDSHIRCGRDLYALEWQEGSRSLLMGTELAQEMGVAPGEAISLSGIPVLCAWNCRAAKRAVPGRRFQGGFYAGGGVLRADGTGGA